jgi:hypothetical protein
VQGTPRCAAACGRAEHRLPRLRPRQLWRAAALLRCAAACGRAEQRLPRLRPRCLRRAAALLRCAAPCGRAEQRLPRLRPRRLWRATARLRCAAACGRAEQRLPRLRPRQLCSGRASTMRRGMRPRRAEAIEAPAASASGRFYPQEEKFKELATARHQTFISPTHKRTEGRAPVWGSEFTSKDAALQGGIQ